jgi:hypothetical protein
MALGVILIIDGDPEGSLDIARHGLARLAEDNEFGNAVLTTAVASFALLAGPIDHEAIATAVQAARRLGNPTMVVNSQFVTVVATWRSDPVGAAQALDECIALTEAGAAAPTLGHMLAIRSVLLALAGDRATALGHLRYAVRFSSTKGDLPMLACVFDYGLQTLEVLGEDSAAAFLTGVALSPLMTLVANLPPAEAPNRDRAIRALRQRTGSPAFDLAVERAGALPLDEAVTRSLLMLDEALGKAPR